MLQTHWYRTPLEIIGQDHFGINVHWRYYTRLAEVLRIRLFSRPVTTRPWNRFPSDTWLCPDFIYSPVAICVLLGFSGLFLIAWNFHFPTYTEKILWRVCSLYHALFSVYGGVYFFIEMVRSRRRSSKSHQRLSRSNALGAYQPCDDLESGTLHALKRSLAAWRNISADGDPGMVVSLRVIIPVSIMCFVYVLARGYIYIEDFMSLRVQPSGVYIGVNKFIPFLG
jgi:hypothetical protein